MIYCSKYRLLYNKLVGLSIIKQKMVCKNNLTSKKQAKPLDVNFYQDE